MMTIGFSSVRGRTLTLTVRPPLANKWMHLNHPLFIKPSDFGIRLHGAGQDGLQLA